VDGKTKLARTEEVVQRYCNAIATALRRRKSVTEAPRASDPLFGSPAAPILAANARRHVSEETGCPDGCGCRGRVVRREFLRLAGAETLALVVGAHLPAMAGPFEQSDFERLVPADKKLRPEWVKSLFDRGEPTVYRGDDLALIGMPVGGICAGQLYIGGDGRLWHWDIFNQHVGTNAAHYAKPMQPASPLQQGFSVTAGGRTWPLDRTGFSDVSFRGQYPIATVEYQDPAAPAAITLEAFSPFIPLNTDDSSLPATVLHFTVRNTSGKPLEATLTGWLENAILLHHRDVPGLRRTSVVARPTFTALECSAEKADPAMAPQRPDIVFDTLADLGTMVLALVGAPPDRATARRAPDAGPSTPGVAHAAVPLAEQLVGELGRTLELGAGQSAAVTFVLTWHFPNLQIKELREGGRFYATKFNSGVGVASYVTEHLERLTSLTRSWRDTWYDSTLPYWLLDRTHLNASILATSTCYRLRSGRFWAWEGVGCCEGTCGHVWQYAHAMARLFPDLERGVREHTDFGLAQQPDGSIHFRGENNDIPAIDAQAGAILRALREHQMSDDSGFLTRIWPRVKRATEWLIAKDADGDGVIEGNQHNTLDTDWFGPVAWLSGLYLAALKASAAMADEMNDPAFATTCRSILARGRSNIVERLFDGEYFVNKPDSRHLDAINSGSGCEIDQVMGQGWAWHVGLPRVLPVKETLSALRSLWRYNFTPDVGPYRERYKAGRWYAMAGEAGLLMCTFPRRDWDYEQAKGKGPDWAAGYFNECMNGFEYQVAGHMIWEGLVQEGLAVTRAVHDRYHASRRNPWNEIECGDHYARSMASYGVFLAACGFEYHGPKGHIGFAPRLSPDNFKAPFTTARAWGTFSQRKTGAGDGVPEAAAALGSLTARIALKHGTLRVRTIALAVSAPPHAVRVSLAGKPLASTHAFAEGRVTITLAAAALLMAPAALDITIA
jgi:non-lysosomal glucosylceramidase